MELRSVLKLLVSSKPLVGSLALFLLANPVLAQSSDSVLDQFDRFQNLHKNSAPAADEKPAETAPTPSKPAAPAASSETSNREAPVISTSETAKKETPSVLAPAPQKITVLKKKQSPKIREKKTQSLQTAASLPPPPPANVPP